MNSGMLRRSDVRRAAAQSSSACSLRGISGNSIWRPERNVQNARSLRGESRNVRSAVICSTRGCSASRKLLSVTTGIPSSMSHPATCAAFPLERTSTVTSPHGRRETTS